MEEKFNQHFIRKSSDRHFMERGFGINQIYFFFSMNLRNLHSTQEAGKW
jgi:hypothetical protein